MDITDSEVKLKPRKKKQKYRYKCTIRLPFFVDCDDGKAQFDKSKRILVLTLPVDKSFYEKKLTKPAPVSPDIPIERDEPPEEKSTTAKEEEQTTQMPNDETKLDQKEDLPKEETIPEETSKVVKPEETVQKEPDDKNLLSVPKVDVSEKTEAVTPKPVEESKNDQEKLENEQTSVDEPETKSAAPNETEVHASHDQQNYIKQYVKLDSKEVQTHTTQTCSTEVQTELSFDTMTTSKNPFAFCDIQFKNKFLFDID